MSKLTLTASNSVYMLSITDLYPVAQRLQGYATDAAFDTDPSEPAEVMKGVDNIMSAGFVPFMTKQSITLQADSPSVSVFEDWLNTMRANEDVLFANANIALPSIGRNYVLTNGVLTRGVAIPGVRRILQPRVFEITWDSIQPSSI